jgi:membrane protein involved in D-alanine export
MTPYMNFLYFGVLLYVAVPTIVHGLFGRLRSWSRGLIALATIFMLVIQYAMPQTVWPGAEVLILWLVIGYALTQWIVARGFLYLRQRAKNRWRFYAAVLAGLAPLITAKYIPVFVPELALGFLGISYLTFRGLDVIICIQDGLITDLPPLQYLAFLLFFPTISAGPIAIGALRRTGSAAGTGASFCRTSIWRLIASSADSSTNSL